VFGLFQGLNFRFIVIVFFGFNIFADIISFFSIFADAVNDSVNTNAVITVIKITAIFDIISSFREVTHFVRSFK